MFEPCDHPNQCNGTKDANVCKGFGNKTLCYCNHGYLELGGKCIQGNNLFFSMTLISFLKIKEQMNHNLHRKYHLEKTYIFVQNKNVMENMCFLLSILTS